MAVPFIGFIALIHRIGVILSIIPSMIVIILPALFPEEEDNVFAQRTHDILLQIGRTGLIILIFSGLIRLTAGIPSLILVKLFFVGITVIAYFVVSIPYNGKNYIRNTSARLSFLVITAIVGIIL